MFSAVSLHLIFLRQGVSLNIELTYLASIAAQGIPGILLSLLPL